MLPHYAPPLAWRPWIIAPRRRRRPRRRPRPGGGPAGRPDPGRGARRAHKTSGSDIVTQADTAAERLIVQQLTAERPDDAIVGEEGTSRPGTSGRTWVIDPVDGTYNFSRGSDWWCSAIALDDEDDVLLGAVHHAASLRTWVGGPDLPSTCDGAPLAALPETAPRGAVRGDLPAPAVLRQRGGRGVRPGARPGRHPADAGLGDDGRDGHRLGPVGRPLPALRGRLGPAARAPRSSAVPAASRSSYPPRASTGPSPGRPPPWRTSAPRCSTG